MNEESNERAVRTWDFWGWEVPRWQGLSVVTPLLLLLGLMFFRVFFVTFIDNYEYGFVYDRMTGKIEKIDRSGWIVRTPFQYTVHSIDLRPYQVTISANARILNAKLVRFNPEGIDTFVEWHGRDAGDQTHQLLEILKCYAFDRDGGKQCPFLTVVGEVAPNQVPQKIKPKETP